MLTFEVPIVRLRMGNPVAFAERYHVSETIIRKLCKRFEIKTFPPGYWAKVYAQEGGAPKAEPSDPPRPNTEESQAHPASKTPTPKSLKP